jgi:hypothetical protein
MSEYDENVRRALSGRGVDESPFFSHSASCAAFVSFFTLHLSLSFMVAYAFTACRVRFFRSHFFSAAFVVSLVITCFITFVSV